MIDEVGWVTVSNALKALPSDGRPRGKLLDLANADDESTKSEVDETWRQFGSNLTIKLYSLKIVFSYAKQN
jgi:hypothetical protein